MYNFLPAEFETNTRRGPFNLERTHKTFLLEELNPGIYNATLQLYKGDEINTTMFHADTSFKVEE